jgi:hypothetical protein
MSETSYPTYDEEARQLVRNKLVHYMRAHRIGTPELANRIQKAQPHNQTIPIKTLQRFLGAKIRTLDSYVAMFERFVQNLPSHDPLGSQLPFFIKA